MKSKRYFLVLVVCYCVWWDVMLTQALQKEQGNSRLSQAFIPSMR